MKNAIQQKQLQQAPMDEIKAIKLLREVLLGERKTELPMNSVQKERIEQKKMPAATPEQITTQSGAVATSAGQDRGCLTSTAQQSTSTGTWARIDPEAKVFVTVYSNIVLKRTCTESCTEFFVSQHHPLIVC